MPVVHQYVDGRGYYIKSRIEGHIVTYQVTQNGAKFLQKEGRAYENARLSLDDLIWMQRKGYVYTHGSGPGEIGPLVRFIGGRKRAKRKRRRRSGGKQQGCCCCSSVVLYVMMFSTAIAFLYLNGRRSRIEVPGTSL